MSDPSQQNKRYLHRYTEFLGMADLAENLLEEISAADDTKEKLDNSADSLLEEARRKKEQLQNRINAKRKKIEEEFEQ